MVSEVSKVVQDSTPGEPPGEPNQSSFVVLDEDKNFDNLSEIQAQVWNLIATKIWHKF